MQFTAGRWLSCLFFTAAAMVLLLGMSASAQTSSAVQQLLTQASQSFSGATALSSVTLTGDVNYTAGGTEESGQVTLVARADGSSSLQLTAGSISRTELQNTFANGQACTWSGSDGVNHTSPGQNCIVPVAWFIPPVALFSSQMPTGPSTSVATTPGAPGDVAINWTMPLPAGVSGRQATLLSHVESWSLLFDNATHLPAELDYSLHPDRDAGTDIPVRVAYSDYQVVNGAEIPFRIQRYFNGTLALDITISSATVTR